MDTDTIHTTVTIKNGSGDTDGYSTVEIYFAGCYGEVYGTGLTEKEINLFKQGVLAERERALEELI